jgi:hypothetical protein
MAADAVYTAIKAFLSNAANVAVLADPTTHVVPPFRYENETFTLPNNPLAPWVDMALSSVLYGQQSIGAETQADNRWDETGHLWLSVFVEAGTGSERVRELAKLLADMFRGLTLLNKNLEFMDSFIGEGQPNAEDGNWFKLPLIIEWRRIEA